MAHSQVSPHNALMQGTQSEKGQLVQWMRILGSLLNLKEHKVIFDPDHPPLDIVMSIVMEVRSLANYHLLYKVGDLMPCDYGTVYESHKRLRPEFLKQYSRRINADALLDLGLSQEGEQDDLELKEAIIYMRNAAILELVDYINNFDNGMLFPGDVANVFHENGIPLRYMGEVCRQITNVFAKHSLEIEMACRALKKIHRNVQTENFFSQGMDFVPETMKTQDFLELVLSASKESLIFWALIIAKQVTKNSFELIQIKYDYSYDIDIQARSHWGKGQLINSLQHHLNLEITLDIKQIFVSKNILIKELSKVSSLNDVRQYIKKQIIWIN